MNPAVFSNSPDMVRRERQQGEKRQRGDVLIEALIGTLMTAIVFVGVNTALSKTLHSQRYSNAQRLALLQMRNEIQTGGIADICSGGAGSATVVGQTVSQSAACTSLDVTFAINSDLSISLAAGDVPATSFSLSTAADTISQGLFGADGVLTMSY